MHNNFKLTEVEDLEIDHGINEHQAGWQLPHEIPWITPDSVNCPFIYGIEWIFNGDLHDTSCGICYPSYIILGKQPAHELICSSSCSTLPTSVYRSVVVLSKSSAICQPISDTLLLFTFSEKTTQPIQIIIPWWLQTQETNSRSASKQ